jgi:hypothetical protein
LPLNISPTRTNGRSAATTVLRQALLAPSFTRAFMGVPRDAVPRRPFLDNPVLTEERYQSVAFRETQMRLQKSRQALPMAAADNRISESKSDGVLTSWYSSRSFQDLRKFVRNFIVHRIALIGRRSGQKFFSGTNRSGVPVRWGRWENISHRVRWIDFLNHRIELERATALNTVATSQQAKRRSGRRGMRDDLAKGLLTNLTRPIL